MIKVKHVIYRNVDRNNGGFPGGFYGKKKKPTCQCRRLWRPGFAPWVRKILWRRKWQPTPVFLPGEFHGQRSLPGCSPWGHRVRHNWVTEHTGTDRNNRLSRLIDRQTDRQTRDMPVFALLFLHPSYFLEFRSLSSHPCWCRNKNSLGMAEQQERRVLDPWMTL